MPLLRCDPWQSNTWVLQKCIHPITGIWNNWWILYLFLRALCGIPFAYRGIARSPLTMQEVCLQLNGILFSSLLLCVYKKQNWGKRRTGDSEHQDMIHFVLLTHLTPSLRPRAGPQHTPHPLLGTYWTPQVTQWVQLHSWGKLQLIFKQQLSASKLITELQSVSCELKSQMECWQRDVTNAMKRLKVLDNRRNV